MKNLKLVSMFVCAVAVVALTGPLTIYAQSSGPGPMPVQPGPQANQPAASKPTIPLKIQVTLSRYGDGEKRTSNLPFTLWVNANDRENTSLNIGIRVPMMSGGQQVSYNNIGTNITCGATTLEDGRFRVYLSINDTSLVGGTKDTAGTPTYQSFTTQNYLILRDGQNAQFVAAVDKINGETTRVDVTATVIK